MIPPFLPLLNHEKSTNQPQMKIHYNLMNELYDSNFSIYERLLLLEILVFYNHWRNERKIINYVTSQNELSKKLGIDKRSLKKALISIGHNTKDLEDNTEGKYFNYTITKNELIIVPIAKFMI